MHDLCVCDCVDVCALAPKQISICPVMTRYRAAGDFSLPPFFHLSSITVQSCIQTTGNQLFSLNKLFSVADLNRWPSPTHVFGTQRDGRSQRHIRVSYRLEF